MEKGRQHICHICSKTYGQTSHLRAHLRIHEENKPFACGMVFLLNFEFGIIFTLNSLDWHLCTWRFNSSSDLKRHLLKHTEEKRFKCEKCGQKCL
jgi:uncharacterized Zn-finger protein